MDGRPISPVTEVALYLEREKIKNTIAKRKGEALQCSQRWNRRIEGDVEAGAAGASNDVVSNGDVVSGADDMTHDAYLNVTAPSAPLPRAQPTGTPATYEVPSTISKLWHEVKHKLKKNNNEQLDHGMCTSEQCIYCRGGVMCQMYALMERMVQLETHLWGRDS